MELKQGFSYIIKSRDAYQMISKIKVSELTKTSAYINFLDTDLKRRYLIDNFNMQYDIVEEIEPEMLNQIEMIKKYS